MIELIVLDVDGCMSDGAITYTSNNEEIKSFNVKDGLAIVSWIKLGKKVAIITGRESKIVAHRAKELGITHLHQNISNKSKALKEILQKENLTNDNIAVIGDDLNDIKMLSVAEISFCPHDAIKYIQNLVNIRLETNGGKGAIREMIDYLITKENLEDEYISLWK